MKETFSCYDENRVKIGRIYHTIEKEIPGSSIYFVDPRNHFTIIYYFLKQVKHMHIPLIPALRTILTSIKDGAVFVNGHFAGQTREMETESILKTIVCLTSKQKRCESMGNEKWSLKRIIELYDQIISQPHRTEIARELRDEDDLFMLLLFSEMLGIPNPVFYYTLELYPVMLEKFHDWHLRMGMEKSPLSGIRCC